MSVITLHMHPCQADLSLKDPVSCMTHLLGCLTAAFAAGPMLLHAYSCGVRSGNLVSLMVFMLSLIFLYGASASYHGFRVEGRASLVLKKLDHMMIFVLIAGSYTPYCSIALPERGSVLLAVIWGLAALGMIFKFFWVTCPRWVSSVMYIAMGWVVAFEIPTLLQTMNAAAFGWLLAGGIVYTIGGIIYALKLVHFRNGNSLWGSHEIFHLFVLGGSVCHYLSLYLLV